MISPGIMRVTGIPHSNGFIHGVLDDMHPPISRNVHDVTVDGNFELNIESPVSNFRWHRLYHFLYPYTTSRG